MSSNSCLEDEIVASKPHHQEIQEASLDGMDEHDLEGADLEEKQTSCFHQALHYFHYY